MNRRDFTRTLGALLPAWVIAKSPMVMRRLKRIGLELYSVRGAMKADPERTLAGIRAIGYTDVELLWSFDNFGRAPGQVKASLDKEGLKAPSAHINVEIITKDWAKSLADARLLGHEYLIAPGLPAESRTSLDVWRQWADRFNVAGAEARKAGIWLAFHNEPDHQKPIGGQVPYDVFIARLDPKVVRLQLDVGNMVMGGGDPMAYLTKHRDRYWSFHVKDVVANRSSDTVLGQGVVNLRSLLGAIPEIENKPCYVEQEGAPDDLVAVTADWKYLSQLDF